MSGRKKGAQPTDTVDSLAERFRAGKAFTKKNKPSKKSLAKAAKTAEEAPAPEVEVKAEEAMSETPATEVAAEPTTEAAAE
jgi:hypothetical protein